MKLFVIIISLLYINNLQSQETNNNYQNVNAQTFNELIKKGDGILLDVRTPAEFNNYHIADAQQLNYYDPDFKQKVLELPKDKPIYIYCNVGNRSSIAAKYLSSQAYASVYNLERGILEWHQANFPLVVNPKLMSKAENQMNMQQFAQIVQTEAIVFFDFYAEWCAPCKKMMPMIDSLSLEYAGKIPIIKINADASQELLKELNVRGIPLLALFKNGEVVFSHNGLIDREVLENVFKQHLK